MTPETTVESHLRSFEARVEVRQAGPCRLLLLPTPVREMVSWRGSFDACPDLAAGDELVQDLAVNLLDKGTRRRDRFAIADVLEQRGAQLQFYNAGLRVGFAGRALREDVPDVLEALAEQLREPLFDADEFEKAKAQVAASIHRSMESTGAQAGAALSRRLYHPAHPNFTREPEEDLARLADLTVADVRAYHEKHFGASDLITVLVGDLDGEAAAATVQRFFGDWPAHDAPSRFEATAAPEAPGRVTLPMPDKNNVDVRMGHPVALMRQDAAFVPLFIGNYVLGGNFSARLMANIRDRMGLTYGIGSSLSGFSTEHEGFWQVNVTLSRENVERGIEATLEELRRFVTEGVMEAELDEKKTTLTGSFKVGLATTGGLAASLLRNAERGFDVGYLDRYAEELEAATLEQVNAAIRTHLHPDRLHFALAGMVEEMLR